MQFLTLKEISIIKSKSKEMLRKSAYLVSIPVFKNKKIFFHLHQLLNWRRTENLLLPKKVSGAGVKDRFRKLNLFVITYPQAEIIFPQLCFLCLLALVSALFILPQGLAERQILAHSTQIQKTNRNKIKRKFCSEVWRYVRKLSYKCIRSVIYLETCP